MTEALHTLILSQITGTHMSYELCNQILAMGTPCHWKPSQAFIYFILAQRYQSDQKPAYPGMEELMRVSKLKRSAVQKHLSVLKKEEWIIQIKRGQTGQRAEYLVRYLEQDMHRCQCSTPCLKSVSFVMEQRVDEGPLKSAPQSDAGSIPIHPKRITKLTNKTKFRINENRFSFVISRIPEEKRVQINGGSNFETLLDEFMNLGVSLEQICNFLGSQKWDNSTAPGGLMETLLRKHLVHMSAERQRNLRETSKSGSVQGQVVQAIAEISNKLNISR
jgi:DNA-binding MarR family transcriptional regulator